MASILVVKSSLNPVTALSSSLADRVAARLRDEYPVTAVTERALDPVTMPHLSSAMLAAIATEPDKRTADQQRDAAFADVVLAEVLAADVVVIAAPMYNFSIPSTLKAWLDFIARAGVTFRYTSDGPQGLLGDKRFVIVSTRGGRHAGLERDAETHYLRVMLNFLGVAQPHFIYAEGLDMGEEARAAGLERVQRDIEALRVQ